MINDDLMINREGIFQNQVTDGIETSALRVAMQNGQLHLVQLLLDHGANPNIFGETSIFFDPLQSKDPATEIEKAVSLLLEHRADPRLSGTAERCTLLSIAKSLGLSKRILCALSKNDGRSQGHDFSKTTEKAEGFLCGLQSPEEYPTSLEDGLPPCAFASDLTPAVSSESRLEPDLGVAYI
ncbi:hypothetical protein BKA61DRAFT_584574 [Leptodontidium sp. MPI-SDFR-AT-0119]|nr:hypothetical protein BKA61DRAFT_584574 [Leptodontidium sp. MPI-SDFR-AT-0119]